MNTSQLAWAAALVTTGSAAGLGAPCSRSVYVRLTRLVGGPAVFPVHSQFFVEEAEPGGALLGFDFLPRDATDPATIRRLLSLQSAPGYVRELRWGPAGMISQRADGLVVRVGTAVTRDSRDVDALRQKAVDGSLDLHLLANPCWRHTLRLASAATGRAPFPIALDVARAAIEKSSAFFFSSAPSPEERANTADEASDDDIIVDYSASRRDAPSVSRLLAEEKVRRFGVDLADLLSDDVKGQAARADREFEDALREAEEGARLS